MGFIFAKVDSTASVGYIQNHYQNGAAVYTCFGDKRALPVLFQFNLIAKLVSLKKLPMIISFSSGTKIDVVEHMPMTRRKVCTHLRC